MSNRVCIIDDHCATPGREQAQRKLMLVAIILDILFSVHYSTWNTTIGLYILIYCTGHIKVDSLG